MSPYLMVDSFLTLLEMGLKWNRRYDASWFSGDAKVCAYFQQLAIYLLLVEMLMQEPMRSDWNIFSLELDN